MNADPNPAKAIFLEAVERHTPDQWSAFLDRACAGQPELRGQVESLLGAHREVGTVQHRERAERADPGPVATIDLPPVTEAPGTVIGPYKLLQQIGEGGMGTVYMAEQTEPVKRKVALKVIKPGMDSHQVIARFEAERQALALMDHVNIARVFDGGTTENGRPYFVMELVHGIPITKYCDDNRLTPRQRLELFVPVCHAIQHAHQKGIIHRDIKPSNVMVTLYDGKPVPKVIDFGVAKATEQKLTERTLFTQYGTLVGTLEYMSPEQAEMSALGVDTRSDIYSLGVLLYELLTGSTPLDHKRMKQAAFAEIVRRIKEEEPPRPSTRLSDSGEALASISANRHTEPAKLTKLVRGELDWIVMKTLEKDRTRRYETANAFAADVQRFLADEPVQACPPSAWYRFRKFARRNKPALATAAVLAVTVLIAVAAVAGSVGWASRDRAARRVAVEHEATLALEDAEQWRDRAKWPEALSAAKRAEGLLAGGGSAELRERARQLRKDLELVLRLEEIPVIDMEDLGSGRRQGGERVDRAYAEAFAAYGLDVLGVPVDQAAARIRARTWVAVHLVDALDSWAGFRQDAETRARLREVAQAADTNPWLRQVREAGKQKDGKQLAALAASPDLLQRPPSCWRMLASSLRFNGQADAGLEVLLRGQRQYPGDFSLNFNSANSLAETKPPRLDEAVAYYRAALALWPHSSAVHLNLGNVLRHQKKVDEATAHYRKAIELDPKYGGAHNNLGIALHHQKKLDEAIVYYRKAIEVDPGSAFAHHNLGVALSQLDRLDDAIASYKTAVELDPTFALAHHNLGVALKRQKRLDEAVASYKTAIKLDPNNASAHINLGHALLGQSKLEDAVAAYTTAINLEPKSVVARRSLGHALRDQGKVDKAVTEYEKAIALDQSDAWSHNALGAALADQKKWDDAIAAYKKAIAIDPKYAVAHANIGRALTRQKKLNEAIDCFHKAIDLDQNHAPFHYELGVALHTQEKLDEAIAAYKKAIELDPKYVSAHYSLGGGLSRKGLVEDAIASYREAIRHRPDHHEAYRNWAWLVTAGPDRKHWDGKRAVELATKLGTLAPKDDRNWVLLGAAHYRAGNWKESLAALQKSMEVRKGGQSTDWFFLAMVNWKLGHQEEARKWFDQAVERMEKNQVNTELSHRIRAEAAGLLRVETKKEK